MRAYKGQKVQSILLVGNEYVGDNIIMSAFVEWAKREYMVQWQLPFEHHCLFNKDGGIELVTEIEPRDFCTDTFVIASYNKNFSIAPKTHMDAKTDRGYLLNCGEEPQYPQFKYPWDSWKYNRHVAEQNKFMPHLFSSVFDPNFFPTMPRLSEYFQGVRQGKAMIHSDMIRIGVFTDSADDARKMDVDFEKMHLNWPWNGIEYIHCLGKEQPLVPIPSLSQLRKYSLRGFASFFCSCDLIVTTNSAPFHIAVAMGIPVIVLMKPGLSFPTWTNYKNVIDGLPIYKVNNSRMESLGDLIRLALRNLK